MGGTAGAPLKAYLRDFHFGPIFKMGGKLPNLAITRSYGPTALWVRQPSELAIWRPILDFSRRWRGGVSIGLARPGGAETGLEAM